MSKLVMIKKRIEKLEEKVAPKHQEEIWVVFWVPPDGDEDTDVECVEMHSGKRFKCKYGEYHQRIEEIKQTEVAHEEMWRRPKK